MKRSKKTAKGMVDAAKDVVKYRRVPRKLFGRVRSHNKGIYQLLIKGDVIRAASSKEAKRVADSFNHWAVDQVGQRVSKFRAKVEDNNVVRLHKKGARRFKRNYRPEPVAATRLDALSAAIAAAVKTHAPAPTSPKVLKALDDAAHQLVLLSSMLQGLRDTLSHQENNNG